MPKVSKVKERKALSAQIIFDSLGISVREHISTLAQFSSLQTLGTLKPVDLHF